MIARSLLFFLLLIVIPDGLLYWRYFCRPNRAGGQEPDWSGLCWWKKLLWWVPGLLMVVYTIELARQPDFMPANPNWLYLYLFLLGLVIIPKALFAICSFFGRWGRRVGWVLIALDLYILFYGSFVGFQKLEVKQVEIAFDDLPQAFDGYRIALFSDAHVGTYTGSRQAILQRAVDSINAQKADAIVFAGDLQNMRPDEIIPHMEVLKQLKAKDGVFSVQGNHDYAMYTGDNVYVKAENVMRNIGVQQELGWDILSNNRRTLRRGDDTIILAGLANEGKDGFPQEANISHALWGVKRDRFVVMIEHDPYAWRKMILPHSHAQLTLSGHTHAMQFELFGWSPMGLTTPEYDGLYELGHRYLYVSKGLGGLIPFRFGATGEIVVITLRRNNQS